jgi:pimeloyl-ACP methyl ester carboxylesterase
MAATNSELVTVDGAQLHYRVRGTGPLLILLAGGDGDAESFDGLADLLVDHFTVVTYDRRGLSRSVIEGPVEGLRLETHSDDVHRLLAHLTNEPVFVFGASIGALIGLDLVARFPTQVRSLVAHEPPAPELLNEPERAQATRAQADVEDAYRVGGIPAAMKKFLEMSGIDLQDRELDAKLPEPTPTRGRNLAFFLSHDAPAVRQYRLRTTALVARSDIIVPAAGETSGNAWPHRCAKKLALLIHQNLISFPGGHAGFTSHPRAFAARLRTTFGSLGQADKS